MSEILSSYYELYAGLPALSALSPHTQSGAYLLSGEDDDGLATAARIVAARLAGIADERALGEVADIIIYPRDDKKAAKGKRSKSDAEKQKKYAISVDDIREITDGLYLTPFELDKRIYIIENAESMSEICQNKLLKSLEEPPQRVCFVLCASGKLLPTVESRCNRIELPPFDVAVVEQQLAKHHKDMSAVKLAARASRGNLGLAERRLKDGNFSQTYDAAKRILQLANGSKMFAKTAAVYDKFSRDKADDVLGIMEYLLCDTARYLVGAGTVFDVEDIKSVAIGFTPLSAANCADIVREARRHNAANGMTSAVLDNMVLKIMEEKVKSSK